VADKGVSIPEQDRERIFDRFARVESERRRTEGAGLGLAIVAAIAEAHGGKVEVGSANGGGNLFTITIPSQERA
jgi:signal transduction histidine kinase